MWRESCFAEAVFSPLHLLDSRPGPVRDEIAALTKDWLVALQDEIAFTRSAKQMRASVDPVQLAFKVHAYVQEANWAFKLFNDKSAFSHARQAIAGSIASASRGPALKKTLERKK